MMALISEQNRKEREEAENEKDMGGVPLRRGASKEVGRVAKKVESFGVSF